VRDINTYYTEICIEIPCYIRTANAAALSENKILTKFQELYVTQQRHVLMTQECVYPNAENILSK